MNASASTSRGGTGVWAMLATPFTNDGELDRESLRNYCSVVVERGCTAVVVNGVVAEPSAMSLRERLSVLETVVEHVDVPVHAAVLSLDDAERLAEIARVQALFGSAVAGLMVPVHSSDPRTLITGLRRITDIADRPLTIQDYPASTRVSIDIDHLIEAVSSVDSIHSVKCEAPSTFARIKTMRLALPHVSAISGLGGIGLIDDLIQGASIAASGLSIPEVIVAACKAFDGAHEERARRLIADVASLIWYETHQVTSIAIRKEHWRRQGVIAHATVRPQTAVFEDSFSQLSDAHGFIDGPRAFV